MMTEELVNDKKSSYLFLRALRNFSDTCEPPALHHDCPFAITISHDLRGCGEECMDLLARFGGPARTNEIIQQNGLTIRRSRRPRPRHSAIRASNAFDARADYLSESMRSTPVQWSLQSLVYRLKELVQTSPWTVVSARNLRSEEISNIIGLLKARGLDFERHLEPKIRFHVMIKLFANVMAASEDELKMSKELQKWREFIAAEGSKLPLGTMNQGLSESNSLTRQTIMVLDLWSRNAAIGDVISWSPPNNSVAKLVSEKNVVNEDEEMINDQVDGRWLVDRFTETYLDRWDSDSLCREWSFIHGQASPPCSPFELRSREVKVSELSAEMSDRLVKRSKISNTRNQSVKPSENLTSMMTSQLVRPAAGFLTQGRFTEARALFEAILQLDPSSADANNNLGFCLIPEDPHLALNYFDKAERLNGKGVELLAVNRMLALASLKQSTAVIDIANKVFGLDPRSCDPSEYKTGDGEVIYLWNVNSILDKTGATLDQVSNLRDYASFLLSQVVRKFTSHKEVE